MIETIKVIANAIMEINITHPFLSKIYFIIFIFWVILLLGFPFILFSINNKLGDIKEILKDLRRK